MSIPQFSREFGLVVGFKRTPQSKNALGSLVGEGMLKCRKASPQLSTINLAFSG